MKRPTRWLEEERVSADVRALLRNAGRSQALPDETRTRSIARLDRYLLWPAAAGLLFWLKGVAIAAGIGVVGVVAVAQIRPMFRPEPAVVAVAPTRLHVGARMASPPGATIPAAPAPVVSAVPAPAGIAPAPPEPTVRPAAPDRAPAARIHLPVPISTQAPPEMDDLTREATMLERARASLDRDPSASLAELDAHAARFPSGALRIERELLAVDALTRAGRRDEARLRAEALLPAAGGTIYEPRLRSLLEKLGEP